MMNRLVARLSIVSALAAALTVSPALAQGKGNGKGAEKAKQGEVRKSKEQRRPELQRRDRDDRRDGRGEVRRTRDDRYEDRDDDRYDERDDDRYDDRYDERYDDRAGGRDKGPPFCRNGQGHPVHGRRWCEEKGYGLGRGRYDDRNGRDGYSRSGRSGSYEADHAEFHRYLDRKYSDLADDRPLDPMYQIRIRRDRKAEHDRWHAEVGRRHD